MLYRQGVGSEQRARSGIDEGWRRPLGLWLLILSIGLAGVAGCGGGLEGLDLLESRDGPARLNGAGSIAHTGSIAVTDDTGHEVALVRPATRVIALAPSATEILAAIGAREQLVGRTIYDRAPDLVRLPSVGDMSNPSLERIVQLEPDLVVALAGNSTATMRRRLAELGIPFFAVEARDTTDIFRVTGLLGALTGRSAGADSLSAALRAGLAEIRASVAGRPTPTVLYLVWHDPPLAAGPGTYIEQLVEIAGGRPAFPDLEASWPRISLEAIVQRQPEIIVVSIGDDPSYVAGQLRNASGWRELSAVREGRIHDLSVDIMNRPGPRLVEAAQLLRDVFHPEAGDEG